MYVHSVRGKKLPVEYRWVDRQTDRTAQHVHQADRQTDGMSGRHTDRQADRRKVRQAHGLLGHTDCLAGTRTVGKTDGLPEDFPGRLTDCRSESWIVRKTDGLPGRHADCLTGRRPPARQTHRH
jgi:hypothetical protein